MRQALSIVAVMIILVCAGCGAPPQRAVSNPDPAGKIPGIEDAVRDHDRSVIPQLVKCLDSDDPAVRFYAIRALHILTGQSFGYRYYDDQDQRRPAVICWKQWLAKQGKL